MYRQNVNSDRLKYRILKCPHFSFSVTIVSEKSSITLDDVPPVVSVCLHDYSLVSQTNIYTPLRFECISGRIIIVKIIVIIIITVIAIVMLLSLSL